MVLTVVAKDFAPELVQIAVGKDLPKSVELKLDRGKRLSIQVVDSHGDPIPEAEIVIRGWKDHSSLYDTNLPSRADKDGLFVWENAPKEAVKCDVRASGFEKHGWVDFTADDEPVVVKLFRPLIARGSVIDGKTNKPIERFTMISQHHDTSGRVSAKRLTTIEGKDGRYELNFPEPRGTHSIRIKVDGYAPQTSAVFQRGQGEVTFDFKLSQSFGVEGKVVSPDGLPVVGATVALTEKKFQAVRLNDGRIENLDDFVTDSTGTDGDFYLISPKKAWKVYVCHELGFARINGTFFETGHELKLSPWASIKGNDLKSYEDETSVEIKLVGVEKADLRLKQQTTTNSDGEYEISKVVPGIQYVVERRVTNLDSDRQFKQPRQVTSRINLAAGAHVLLGQPGRKVVGKVTFEGWRRNLNGYAKAKARLPRYPKGFDDWDVARQQKWKSNWSKTEAGIRYHTSRSLEYPLKFEGDRGTGEASFEIEALPPGFYEVAIELDTSLGESSKKTLKLHVKKIAVEERDPQPQNMGVIEFKTSFGD